MAGNPAASLIEGRSARGIAESVEAAVAADLMPAGTVLPPVRQLSADLGVNANTVASAYRLLRERGVIETGGRRGSRIRPRSLPSRRTPAAPHHTSTPAAPPPAAPPPAGPRDLRELRDLSTGCPDPALLPSLEDAAARAADGSGGEDSAASAVRPTMAADGVPCEAMAVVSGTLDGVERALAGQLRPGDRVAVEDPGWPQLFDLLGAMGLVAVPLRVDAQGPSPQDLAEALDAGARAVAVTSRAQNPTGASISEARAKELRAVLAEHPGVMLLEDDYAAGLVDDPLHTLAGATDRWIHVRSVSKALGPDLRLAVLAGDPGTVERVRARQLATGTDVSPLLQRAVAELYGDPAARAGVREAAARYAERRRALVAALAERGVRAMEGSGLNVWVPVADESAAFGALLVGRWVVAPGARFRLRSGAAVRVTVATVGVGEVGALAEGVARAVSSSFGSPVV
ncbi:aminotransferase class I/II-fold pyridoxal phosphate-dependent enzyme [Streptomyces sp. NPDC051907]|uniref:aminotransferase class I/II-fold pyridoxal phosphate-dependent enzyme n=1 Tax=Streptomyces sp. NPDC051907 TaxID=3155284 RepID=UPI003433365A